MSTKGIRFYCLGFGIKCIVAVGRLSREGFVVFYDAVESCRSVRWNVSKCGEYTVRLVCQFLSLLVWDQNRLSRFNWLWFDTTTFDRYTEETSFENSLLVQQTGSLALTSLTHVLRSLTPNARGIFKLLVEYQLENDSDTNYMGKSYAFYIGLILYISSSFISLFFAADLKFL